MNSSYWSPDYRLPSEREEILVDEVLLTVTGEGGYPGDLTPSDNWPNVAPGTRGILNALSGKYCGWAGIVDMGDKPAHPVDPRFQGHSGGGRFHVGDGEPRSDGNHRRLAGRG